MFALSLACLFTLHLFYIFTSAPVTGIGLPVAGVTVDVWADTAEGVVATARVEVVAGVEVAWKLRWERSISVYLFLGLRLKLRLGLGLYLELTEWLVLCLGWRLGW